MKKLLVFLVSILLLSSPSVFADDISDFEIEGMSIGDSLLDYMTKEAILAEIETNKNDYLHLNEPYKYAEVYLWKDFPTYDSVTVKLENISSSKYVGNKNEKYTILSVRGLIDYNEDFDSCLQKRDEIAADLSKVFINVDKWESISASPADPSGNSIIDGIWFNFDSGDSASIYCNNWEETFRNKNNLSEGLTVSIKSEEISKWLRDY
jgi:hypothetical protein